MIKKKPYNTGDLAESVFACGVVAKFLAMRTGRAVVVEDIFEVIATVCGKSSTTILKEKAAAPNQTVKYNHTWEIQSESTGAVLVHMDLHLNMAQSNNAVFRQFKHAAETFGDASLERVLTGTIEYVNSAPELNREVGLYVKRALSEKKEAEFAKIIIDSDGISWGKTEKADVKISAIFTPDEGEDETIEKNISLKTSGIKQIAQYAGGAGSGALKSLASSLGVPSAAESLKHSKTMQTEDYISSIVTGTYKSIAAGFNKAPDGTTKANSAAKSILKFMAGGEDEKEFTLLNLDGVSTKVIEKNNFNIDILSTAKMRYTGADIEPSIHLGDSGLDGAKTSTGTMQASLYHTPDSLAYSVRVAAPKLEMTVEINGKVVPILSIRSKAEFSSKRVSTLDGVLKLSYGADEITLPEGTKSYGAYIRNYVEIVPNNFSKLFEPTNKE